MGLSTSGSAADDAEAQAIGRLAQIRADHVELLLMEFEAGEGGHVRCVNRKPRTLIACDQISIGSALEERLIQYLGHEVRATKIGRPEPDPIAGRPEHSGFEFAFPVLPQKARFEVMKNLIAAERIVPGGEGASGQGEDDVQFVKQALLLAFPGDLLLGKFP